MNSTKIQQDFRAAQDAAGRASLDEPSSVIDGLLEKEILGLRRKTSFWRHHIRAICVHSIIFLLYLTTLSLLMVSNNRLRVQLHGSRIYCEFCRVIPRACRCACPICLLTFTAPANEAVEWEVTEWHAGDGLHEPYVGEPRPELEDAWRGLLGSKHRSINFWPNAGSC